MSEISAAKDTLPAALENKRGIKGANQERMRQDAAESPKSAEHLKKESDNQNTMLDIGRMTVIRRENGWDMSGTTAGSMGGISGRGSAEYR